jgi:hypothetical protein
LTAKAGSELKVGWSDTQAKLIIQQGTVKIAVCVLSAKIALYIHLIGKCEILDTF